MVEPWSRWMYWISLFRQAQLHSRGLGHDKFQLVVSYWFLTRNLGFRVFCRFKFCRPYFRAGRERREHENSSESVRRDGQGCKLIEWLWRLLQSAFRFPILFSYLWLDEAIAWTCGGILSLGRNRIFLREYSAGWRYWLPVVAFGAHNRFN